MKGLLLKDCYTLIKQLRIMLLILAIFACMPGYSLASFAVFYAAMLPVTALAYDERSKWNELAAMLPYSVRDIVLSKYLLGMIAVAIAAVISFAAQSVLAAIQGAAFETEEVLALLLISFLSLILLSVNLPIMFRLGVEKGRIAFMILICGGVAAGMALRDRIMTVLDSLGGIALPFAATAALTAVIIAASVPISICEYKKKNG